jgi:ribosome-associated translation inhibitor RaiA
MKVQVNTDNHIEGHEGLVRKAEATVEASLGHLAQQVTRVEVHISDENARKEGGNDKRCMMEARLEGLQPIAVTHQAPVVDQAVDGAADKLATAIENTLGKLRDQRSRRTDPPPAGATLTE